MNVEMICSLQSSRSLNPVLQNSTNIITLSGSLSSTSEVLFSKTLTAGRYKINYLFSGAIYTSGSVARLFVNLGAGNLIYFNRQSFESSINEYALVSMADQYIELSTNATVNFLAEEYSSNSSSDEIRKIMAHLTIEEVI